MRIALIADAYSPIRSSAAVQMRDLAHELVAQGHAPTVIVPSTFIEGEWSLENEAGVEVFRVAAPRTKDIGRVHRVVAEMLLPYVMLKGVSKSPLLEARWDGVVWYSPSIFMGPLVNRLKRNSGCRTYLILRDLFPEWAADARVIRRGPAFHLLKWVAHYQYSLADTIGVQSPANVALVSNGSGKDYPVEVLYNWLSEPESNGKGPLIIRRTNLKGRKIFVYSGNMGISQDMPAVLHLAARMQRRKDAGFLFVGRGTEVPMLRSIAQQLQLDNVLFHDEIEPWEVPGLLSQCHIGIIALDPRHTTHNVPGKFLSYLRAGLPILARINPGNDMEKLIHEERIGLVSTEKGID
ncbi:MAG TPA: glycosyltransferase family 4 protein, partial [Gemmatimonadaceae bacterium]|nr:glycosyltransferase family 4 protein [Gemmatimonadaceae bacterium]